MQSVTSQNTAQRADLSSPDFRHVRNSLTCDDMQTIRTEVAELLQSHAIAATHIGNLLLALTEILSNLVKHPERKADYIEIRVSQSDAQINLEVLDNSTHFANFNAKCESSLSDTSGVLLGNECGYGLSCILKLYKNAQYTQHQSGDGWLNCFAISHKLEASSFVADKPVPKEKRRVFLIDDDLISLTIHRQMLEGTYNVFTFENAESALEAFVSDRPDIIVSDLTMPGIDGVALREALSGLDGGDITPFIFLSGHTGRQNNLYISQLGVDDFLCKPVTYERLHTVLARLLRRSQQIRSSVQSQFNQDITALLKPDMPQYYGPWMFQSRHQAAEAGGGDFILHHQTSESMVAVLADVMGHGRQAKFFSYVYAGYLHSMFRMKSDILDAGSFLRALSTSIDNDPLLENMIMTCLCFQFFQDGFMKVASAGHPRPILLHKGCASFVNVAGPLPGLAGDSVYDMKSLQLSTGDKILFMTDGFLEVFHHRGQAARELLTLVQSIVNSSRGEIVEKLWQVFEEKGEQYIGNRDDATIVLAEYGGK